MTQTAKALHWLGRHKRFLLVVAATVALNAVYGFDARFTIINIVWIFISVVKIDQS